MSRLAASEVRGALTPTAIARGCAIGQTAAVKPARFAWLGALAFALLAACNGGADGGAVELSWRLRPAEGPLPDNPCSPFVCCDQVGSGTGPIDQVRLDWQVGSAQGSTAWGCNLGDGVTGFDLPPGEALLTVSPVCTDGTADPATFAAPAPIARTVIAGGTISLGAVEIVLQVSSCTQQTCICAPPP